MNKRITILKNLFLIILIIHFLILLSIPFLINEGVSILSEELTESILILLLFITASLIYLFYQRELKNSAKNLEEALSYIGAVNVQVEQIRSFFSDIKKYPESKSDFKYIMQSLAVRILGIVNCDWVHFRIIEVDTLKTLSEYSQPRGNATLLKYEIGNKSLIEGQAPVACLAYNSDQKNLNLKAFCIIPETAVNDSQRQMIVTIVNGLSMFYVIFTSLYYRDTRLNNNHKPTDKK